LAKGPEGGLAAAAIKTGPLFPAGKLGKARRCWSSPRSGGTKRANCGRRS